MAPCARCVAYLPDTDAYKVHYQRGSGNFPVFRGTPYQEGHGIGGVFSSIFKTMVPVLKRTAVTAGKQLEI